MKRTRYVFRLLMDSNVCILVPQNPTSTVLNLLSPSNEHNFVQLHTPLCMYVVIYYMWLFYQTDFSSGSPLLDS